MFGLKYGSEKGFVCAVGFALKGWIAGCLDSDYCDDIMFLKQQNPNILTC
jgi:hypothetical protein